MRINGFRCDGCGKEYLLELGTTLKLFSGDALPEGWFIVYSSNPKFIEPWLFCSKRCLHLHPLEHIEKQPGTEEAPTPPTVAYSKRVY